MTVDRVVFDGGCLLCVPWTWVGHLPNQPCRGTRPGADAPRTAVTRTTTDWKRKKTLTTHPQTHVLTLTGDTSGSHTCVRPC